MTTSIATIGKVFVASAVVASIVAMAFPAAAFTANDLASLEAQLKQLQSQLQNLPVSTVLGAATTTRATTTRPTATSTSPQVIARCVLNVEGRRAVLAGQDIKLKWESTGATKVEFLPATSSRGLTLPTASLRLNGEATVRATEAGEYTVRMRATSRTGNTFECFRTITVLNANNNGATTTNRDITVAALRARISQQEQGIARAEALIAERQAQIAGHRENIAKFQAEINRLLGTGTSTATTTRSNRR